MKTEQQTRMELIDTALKRAVWNVDDPGQVVQEYDILVDSASLKGGKLRLRISQADLWES